jgi:hypothetical protein
MPTTTRRVSIPNLSADLRAIRSCYRRDTSELPDRWTSERPSTGHCHVVALLLQQRHGGQILRGTVDDGISFTHYLNAIDGAWIDTTVEQFAQPAGWGFVDATHEVLNEATLAKWALLTERFNADLERLADTFTAETRREASVGRS